MKKDKEYEFWLDEIARKIIEREKKLKRNLKVINTESGLGASGIPHIGSLGDVIRQYGVTMALRDAGVKSELIAFADDRDGLRKVPVGLPNWLEKDIGKPVSDIKDPFGCHNSFGEHMCSLLLEGTEKMGIDCKFQSGSKTYKKGILDKEIEKILLNSIEVGKIIKKLTGQDKYMTMVPYFPVCEKCGRIYTTRVYKVLPKEHKVLYVCDQEFVGKNKNTGKPIVVKGCGHKGEASYFKGEGKLSWKSEFAARWKALSISFEAHGKDILDSIKVNDEICDKILGWKPPMHFMYEMFLEKGGKKISKSVGNVFTPQTWFRFGTPESLFLLMFKRSGTIRELDVTDIPKYIEEVNQLEDIYFNKIKEKNKRDEFNKKRLFEYIHKLNPPQLPSVHIPYDYLVKLVKIAPAENKLDFVIDNLIQTKHIEVDSKEIRKSLKQMIEFAENWNEEFGEKKKVKIELQENEKYAIKKLIEIIKEVDDPDTLQNAIFETAKSHTVKPIRFFTILYMLILEEEKGPRLGPYILQRGKEEIIQILESKI